MRRPVIFGIGKLGLKLAIAFLGVALTAIIVVTGLTEINTGHDVGTIVMRQEHALSRAVAIAAGEVHSRTGWRHAPLDTVLDLAEREGSAVEVHDTGGKLIQRTPGFAGFRANNYFAMPIVDRGKPVGWVTIKFGGRGLGHVVPAYDSARLGASLGAAGIVALVALVVSLLISRQITLPVERVVATIRARGAGDRSARVTEARGTGVIAELAAALNESNDAIDKRDILQRNLVANIAHELRTPVAILQASHEAMIDGVTPPTTENLWSLRDEVLRLARMIEDLQRLAAAEAAALQINLEPGDLSIGAADAAASLADSFAAAEVSFVMELRSVGVLCDHERMREVIVNLLTNALKFTPAGGRVVLETGPAGPGLAQLTVSDTGIGIPADELPRVTERFFRGQRSSEMAAGTGIGLTIVAELVRAQHGHLHISSEPGKGTRATITIPSIDLPGPGVRQERSSRSGPAGSSRPADPEDPARAKASLIRLDRFGDVQPSGSAASPS